MNERSLAVLKKHDGSQNTHSLRNYHGGTDLISLKLCIKEKESPAKIHLAETFLIG